MATLAASFRFQAAAGRRAATACVRPLGSTVAAKQFSSSASTSDQTSVAAAAAKMRARWAKLGGEGSAAESRSALASSASVSRSLMGSRPVPATAVEGGASRRSSTVERTSTRGLTTSSAPLPPQAVGLLSGDYIPLTQGQAGRMPMPGAVNTWKELRRAQTVEDDFETFI